MYGKDILCGISKGTFEIPYKISYQYIERWWFYTILAYNLTTLQWTPYDMCIVCGNVCYV